MFGARFSAVWRAIRSNLVIAFVVLTLLFLNIFVFYLLQEKVNKEKIEITRPNKIDMMDQAAAFGDIILDLMDRNASEEELRQSAKDFLSQDNIFFRVEFYPFINTQEKLASEKPTFVYEMPNKQAELNNHKNCLFTLDFSDDGMLRRKLGVFRIYHASPQNWPEIEVLIWKYRIYAGLFFLASFSLFFMMLRKILLPLRRVSRSLEMMSEEYIPLLDKPKVSVEIAYNSVARNARLTQLGVLLNELVSDTPKEMLRGEDPVVEAAHKVPLILCDYMHFRRVILFQREDSSGRWEWGYGYDVELGELSLPESFGENIDLGILIRQNKGSILNSQDLGLDLETKVSSRQMARQQCAIVPILHNNRALCFALFWSASGNTGDQELLESVGGVRAEIEETFLKIISGRTLLDKEKNEVSIHLSTNLGHDLTNIIATGKWDLETIKRGVDRGIVKVYGQPIQAQRFNEAVDGLVNNSRMLQEVVNIYRAFGYASRPTYERLDINKLIKDLAHLFELSTSKSVQVGFDLKADPPEWVVEPRMFKLVLFNMLTNSIQSISKLQERNEETTGEIKITNLITPENWLAIHLLDAGTGFRNEAGNPMTRSELRKIFRYGFTTKRDEARGGLGLSWVWTIVTEFHEGQIIPENRPEGGAKMTVLIPPLDHRLMKREKPAIGDLPMM